MSGMRVHLCLRAVVALAGDPKVLDRSGRAFASRELADGYGFTDVDGSLPKGPLHEIDATHPEELVLVVQ